MLARNAEPLGLRPCGDHQNVGDVFVAAISDRLERRSAGDVHIDNRVPHHARTDMLGLLLHLLHQPGALDNVCEAGIVFDIGRDGQLAAGLQPLHHDGLHHCSRCVNGGRISCRSRADDKHLGTMGSHVVNSVSLNGFRGYMGTAGPRVTPRSV